MAGYPPSQAGELVRSAPMHRDLVANRTARIEAIEPVFSWIPCLSSLALVEMAMSVMQGVCVAVPSRMGGTLSRP